jgi:hypothetical protein
MLSVTNSPFMLSAVMPNVIQLSVVRPRVIAQKLRETLSLFPSLSNKFKIIRTSDRHIRILN